MDIFVIKMPNGSLMPAHEPDREGLRSIKAGQPCRVKLTRVRNYEFHKKYFALLQFAFDHWDPPESGYSPVMRELLSRANIEPTKNFDRFRKDLIILAGYYDATFRLNGDARVEAKSISFANMSENEFEKLYSATIDVVVRKICTHYTGDSLRQALEIAEGFEWVPSMSW